MPDPLNPRAWDRARIDAYKERGLWKGSLKKSAPNWDARLAQRATQIYKERGHGWSGEQKGSSLNKWTREKWGYVLGDPKGRYLPQSVRDKMSTSLKRRENEKKKECTAAGKKRCPYLPETQRIREAVKKSK